MAVGEIDMATAAAFRSDLSVESFSGARREPRGV
jgi:hypothetical protein